MFLAADAAMGIALLPDWVAGPAIQQGRLVQLLPQLSAQPCMQTDIHVLRALAQPAIKLRTFIDALKQHIGAPEHWSL
jgi:DNA-binding transcriptional LysR family regulator